MASGTARGDPVEQVRILRVELLHQGEKTGSLVVELAGNRDVLLAPLFALALAEEAEVWDWSRVFDRLRCKVGPRPMPTETFQRRRSSPMLGQPVVSNWLDIHHHTFDHSPSPRPHTDTHLSRPLTRPLSFLHVRRIVPRRQGPGLCAPQLHQPSPVPQTSLDHAFLQDDLCGTAPTATSFDVCARRAPCHSLANSRAMLYGDY